MSRFLPSAARLLASLLKLVTNLVEDGLRFFRLTLRSPAALSAEILFLRKQLAFYEERQTQPRRRGCGGRERGHPRLAARTYEEKCTTCMWGCHMAAEMTIDQWKPSKRRYRTETFGYGPRSCPLYRSGPARKIPGRRGMSYTEEDWIDDEAISHRGLDE